MINPDAFLTHTLRAHPQGAAVTRILASAVQAAAPDEAVRRAVRRERDRLVVGPDNHTVDLSKIERIFVLGLGKAAHPMTEALVEYFPERELTGLLVVKHLASQAPRGFEQVLGGHPVPDAGSLQAARKLFDLLKQIGPTDLLICLISGGGSALMTAPLPGVSLADIQALTGALLGCGASIDEINTLRRHLDQFKGGRLARMAAPAQIISLILSDVINSPFEAIASGPTAPDPSSLEDALGILKKYNLVDTIPAAVTLALRNSAETPKPGSDIFNNVYNLVVADLHIAAQAAMRQARQEGITPMFIRGDVQGFAADAAAEFLGHLKNALAQPAKRPFCIFGGGETTVILRGKGRGGRNQELVLNTVAGLANLPDCVVVSLATDGEDGPTDAAGAVASTDTLLRGQNAGLDPFDFLANNDSYRYFSSLGDLLKPGPTGTNVNDLIFVFGF